MGQQSSVCDLLLQSCSGLDMLPDDNFDNSFEVDQSKPLGRGKFGEVFLCWRRSDPSAKFALKEINTKLGDMASLNRIRDEITILRMLGEHRCLVSLVDTDESIIGKIRLVLEFCEGGELYDRIQQKGTYSEMESKHTMCNLFEAVQFIHERGIMHRDLKPENILLVSRTSHTDVKISDFGLAKMSPDYPRRLPRSHSICGSDYYLAPEVIKQEEYGREIDIWALGVITYVLLSGSLPFFHQVLHKLYRQIVERDLSFSSQCWKGVSKGAIDFMLRLLQVRPGDRLTAEQGLHHPWLRLSKNSFNATPKSGPPGQNAGRPGGHTPAHSTVGSSFGSDIVNHVAHNARVPYPLEHAHRVQK